MVTGYSLTGVLAWTGTIHIKMCFLLLCLSLHLFPPMFLSVSLSLSITDANWKKNQQTFIQLHTHIIPSSSLVGAPSGILLFTLNITSHSPCMIIETSIHENETSGESERWISLYTAYTGVLCAGKENVCIFEDESTRPCICAGLRGVSGEEETWVLIQ